MAKLEGQTIAASYDQLLHVDTEGGGNTTTHVSVKDGNNDTTFALTLATDAVMITSTNRLEFGDDGTYIHQSADGVLDLVSDTEIEINATDVDMNGALDLDGTFTQDAGAVVFNEAGADYDFRVEGVGAANALFVQGSDGFVGIGTASPASNCHIEDTGAAELIIASSGMGGATLKLIDSNASGDTDSNAVEILGIAPTGNEADMRFRAANSSGTMTERMRIDGGTGNVGIGTAAPGSELDLGGGYMANEQGRQDHVANTMPQPYYRFDGVDDLITIADNANLDFGTGDFSVEALVYIPTGGQFTFGKLQGWTAQGWFLRVQPSSGYRLRMDDSDGGNLDTGYVADNIPADVWVHVLVTFDRDGSYTIYQNGVNVSSASITGYDASIDGSGDLLINGYPFSGTTYTGPSQVAMVRQYNHALSAAEVKELYSGASVPYKYKGANQTNVIAGWDFTSGWTATGLGNGNAADDNNSFTSASDSQWFRKNFTSSLTTGKRYRLRVAGTISAGDLNIRDHAVNNDIITGLSGTFDESLEFTAGETTNPTREDDGFAFHTADSGSTVDITALEYIPIGAVAEYDGSSAGAHQWGDKSGNDLHGTVGDGAGGASAPSLENTPYDAGTEYEEGTWTPVYEAASGNNFGVGASSITYTATAGRYTKIGRIVTIEGSLKTDSLDITGMTAGASLYISGLPFGIVTSDSAVGVTVCNQAGWTNAPMFGQATQSFSAGTSFRLEEISEGDSAYSPILISDMDAASDNRIAFSFVYEAA